MTVVTIIILATQRYPAVSVSYVAATTTLTRHLPVTVTQELASACSAYTTLEVTTVRSVNLDIMVMPYRGHAEVSA